VPPEGAAVEIVIVAFAVPAPLTITPASFAAEIAAPVAISAFTNVALVTLSVVIGAYLTP